MNSRGYDDGPERAENGEAVPMSKSERESVLSLIRRFIDRIPDECASLKASGRELIEDVSKGEKGST